ncbi:hypothetical protein ACLB2K_047941 [Fragaria x ananassa]
MGGSKYFVTFLDDFSRKIWAYFMKEKSEVLFKVKKGKSKVGNLEGRKFKYLRSNGGIEYRMKGFLQFYKDEITRCITVKDNLQENRAVRRMKKTLFERERGMRLHTGLPDTFWKEAVNHACYLTIGHHQRSWTSSVQKSKKRVLSRYVINDDKIKPFNEVKTSEVKKKKTDVDVVDEATEVPLTKGIMEETSAQVEQIEQVEHDKGVIEVEVLEQQQHSLIQAQVEQLTLRTYDSVCQLLEQEF